MQYQGGKSRIASKLAAVIRQWLPNVEEIDHNAFWNWVENRRGPTFISEIEAPDTAQCIWQQDYKGQANNSDNASLVAYRTRTERLFYYPGTYASQPAPTVPPCPA